ncbi:MAG: 16S rRNA (guanine(527)-N(7))-methyltransferase RsmG [Solirubrobacteraceae bacterium]
MKPRSLTTLAARYELESREADQLGAVLDELAQDDRAPTTVRDPERAVEVHLADSLVALEVDRLHSAGRVADIGTGAGFPALPLAVALPASEMRLVESQAKKCQFLRRVVAAAGVDNAEVVERRAEEWPEGLGAHDAVLARALAPAPVVLEYAAPLLDHGGVLVDWRGRRDSAREAEAVCAAEQLGMRLLEIRRTEPYEGAREHHLHVFEKVAETPSRFPRRAGVARKRPLGC